MNCPLCLSSSVSDFKIAKYKYWRCAVCALTFLDPEFHFTPDEERARYDLHRNNPDDPGYIQFLNKLAGPFSGRLKAGARGLDFGCGPGPAMSVILKKQGFSVDNYDPYYFPDPELLGREYDFLTCTEVVEHLREPRKEFLLLDRLLKKGGRIGVMTEILTSEVNFEKWWYRLDPTHIAFYKPETFEWISKWLEWRLEFPVKNVVIFSK